MVKVTLKSHSKAKSDCSENNVKRLYAFSHSKDTWSNSHNLGWSLNVNRPCATVKNERYDR